MRHRLTLQRALLMVGLLVVGRPAAADAIFDITLDTTPLVGHPAGPFYFALSFIDGSGIGDGNNTARIDHVDFGGGATLGGPIAFGGVTGDLTNGVTITDTAIASLFFEPFMPGGTLRFRWTTSAMDDIGGIPDRVIFGILDSAGTAIPTLAPFGDFFVGMDLRASGLFVEAYGSDPERAPTIGEPVWIATPTVTTSAVPEPGTLVLLSMGLSAITMRTRSSFTRKLRRRTA